jgi:hypothetical protein
MKFIWLHRNMGCERFFERAVHNTAISYSTLYNSRQRSRNELRNDEDVGSEHFMGTKFNECKDISKINIGVSYTGSRNEERSKIKGIVYLFYNCHEILNWNNKYVLAVL